MKLAITSILALATTAVAFTQGHSAFTRKATLCNMSEAADFVKAQTSGNDVVIFSKSYCPFCTKTKDVFDDMDVDATVYELNQMDDGADIQEALMELTGQRTVPNVFIKGEHLGGNDDTQKAAKDGKIAEALGL